MYAADLLEITSNNAFLVKKLKELKSRKDDRSNEDYSSVLEHLVEDGLVAIVNNAPLWVGQMLLPQDFVEPVGALGYIHSLGVTADDLVNKQQLALNKALTTLPFCRSTPRGLILQDGVWGVYLAARDQESLAHDLKLFA